MTKRDAIGYNKFIFSDERNYRIIRHLIFWGTWGLYFGLVRQFNPLYWNTGKFPDPATSLAQSFSQLLPHAILVYPFIMPRYIFNGKYIKGFLVFIPLLLIAILINSIFIITIPWYQAIWVRSKESLFVGETTFLEKLPIAYMTALLGALAGAALAACFKMFKYHYVQDINNQQLLKENIEAQLRLLRAQVHPHFLFNTLNNIYSQTQTESPKGSKMIMGLSDMLRYILYEGQKPLVPLEQELVMIREYFHLEKTRYGNDLDVHLLTPVNSGNLYIAPLLLLPFVENCFKNGTGDTLQNPWISLTVEIKGTALFMKLMNGKVPVGENEKSNQNIGISNVRQRLELLYKNKYDLQITEDEEVFVVDLRVDLVSMENNGPVGAQFQT
jgi:sensor histidine kinase YesM